MAVINRWHKKLIFVLTLMLLANLLYAADKEQYNYCNDKNSWGQWESLLADNPVDKDIRLLYALRIGLCVMVDRQELSLQEATKIFERQRDALIQEKQLSNSQGELSI